MRLLVDGTLWRRFPPLPAAWSRVGAQTAVAVTGQNAKHVLFGSRNVHTGPRVVLCRKSAGGADARTFLSELRRRSRKAPTIWLLLDRAPAHTDGKTLRRAAELSIELVWLPKQWSELNAMDQLWKHVKRDALANRRTRTIDASADRACAHILAMNRHERLRQAGVLSGAFWLAKGGQRQ